MTVRRWIKAGRIGVVQVGREVRVPRSEIERIVGSIDGRLVVLYGRVSGHGQKDDLETQLERCKHGQRRSAKDRRRWSSPILAVVSKQGVGPSSAYSSWSVRIKWRRW